jgi:hypothetical protein
MQKIQKPPMCEWHTLHDEGQCTESVRYLGSGRWTYESVDFLSGTTVRDRLSTKRLIELIHGWECDELEMARVRESKTESDGKTLGPRGLRLLTIAKEVGADRCYQQLSAIRTGQWPPAPKIKAITGIGIRSVWRGVTHKVFIAQTNHGEAYVYPPRPDNVAKVVLKSACSTDQGWLVALSAKNLRDLEEYKAHFEAKPLAKAANEA